MVGSRDDARLGVEGMKVSAAALKSFEGRGERTVGEVVASLETIRAYDAFVGLGVDGGGSESPEASESVRSDVPGELGGLSRLLRSQSGTSCAKESTSGRAPCSRMPPRSSRTFSSQFPSLQGCSGQLGCSCSRLGRSSGERMATSSSYRLRASSAARTPQRALLRLTSALVPPAARRASPAILLRLPRASRS